jgi:replicative DNA helicase
LLDTIDNIEKRRQGEIVSPIRFGIERLDQRLCGLQPGELVVIGAPTCMGKSALGMQAALQTAKAHKSCVLFSLEMTAENK